VLLLFSKDFVSDIFKSCVFTLVSQLQKNALKQSLSVGVEQQATALSSQKKPVWIPWLELVATIDLTGGQSVTEHFRYIFFGHFNADNTLSVGAIVRPKFKVMSVSALVMHPGGTVSIRFSLRVVGAAVTLKIAGASPEFQGRIFGQVVCQPLPV